MNAQTLLNSVGATYRELKTLEVECLLITESGDKDHSSRGEQRIQAFYKAPQLIRIQQGGRRGSTTVADGDVVHHYFGMPPPGRYVKSHTPPSADMLPGMFRPEFPIGHNAIFLFHHIEERVQETSVLGQEDCADNACHVVAARYAPSLHPALIDSDTPIIYWIDTRTLLVRQMQGTISHRMPAGDEVHTSQIRQVSTKTDANADLPLEIFDYAPPPSALTELGPLRGGGFVSGGGGGGMAELGPDGRRFEQRQSHHWDGRSLVQTARLRFDDLDVSFERRFTLSEDRKELRMLERISGPAEEVERDYTIRMDE